MTDTSYDRAVAQFEELINAPLAARLTTPAAMARAAGLASSSGYRHIAALEADQFLQRNEAGAYVRGASAERVGLRACGIGALSTLVQPVLVQLRQSLNLTCFLGLSDRHRLKVCAFTRGRDNRTLVVEPSYYIEMFPSVGVGQACELLLQDRDNVIGQRNRVLAVPVEKGASGIVLIGLFLSARRADVQRLMPQLERAAERVVDARREV